VVDGRSANMMTIRRLSVGSGYKYLLKSIAIGDGPEGATTSDLVRYYNETGTPPGLFLGAGLAALDGGRGVEVGQIVTSENLKAMLQDCADPITGDVLGRAPSAKAVGGFDLTFSPAKSISVAWALGDHETRNVIFRCHQDAISIVLAYAEAEVFKTRSGRRGCVEEDIVGVVAASFTHFNSRDGDPQLHDHVVVLNRVQAKSDGLWRTLDSRGLFASAVMLSELHQGVLADLLTSELGWDWEPHARRSSIVPKWEVANVAESLMEEFSRRSADIVALKDELVAQFEADHARVPTDTEVLKLRQTATLATRRAKEGRSLAELTRDWTHRALPYLEEEPTSWVHELGSTHVASYASEDFADAILGDVANTALEVVSTKRATFSRANVQAEVFRQLQGVRFSRPVERIATATRTTDLALAQALLISTPNLHHTPRFLLRADGTSKFEATGQWRYTTTTLLNAEARLLDAAERTDAPTVALKTLSAVVSRVLPGRSFALSPDQARCVSEITTSARCLDVLVGPAGTGKSTAMAGLRAAWERQHGEGSVIALAPSAASAEVLGEDMGLEAETLAKWLYEHRQRGARSRELNALRERNRGFRNLALRAAFAQREEELRRWSLRSGQLIVVDEASLASTFALDELVSAALDARAKVLLVGDPAQLSSIDAGGMFRTLLRPSATFAASRRVGRRARPSRCVTATRRPSPATKRTSASSKVAATTCSTRSTWPGAATAMRDCTP
jgi:conjugative relaxase-like TrwC/TraI family protein